MKIKSIHSSLLKQHGVILTRFHSDAQFKRKALILAGSLVLSCAALWNWPNADAKVPPPDLSDTLALDRAIPENYVLVPIQVQNGISLEGVFEDVGYVDLYSVPEEGKRSEHLLSNVKMIRSPKNREQFAVVIPSSSAVEVAKARGNFFVMLQSRDHHRDLLEKNPAGRSLTLD